MPPFRGGMPLPTDHFTYAELACKHCGDLGWTDAEVETLEELRVAYDRPMHLTSAYRCPQHPDERDKVGGPGEHSRFAIDVACSGAAAYSLIATAIRLGVPGIGISQKNPDHSKRFIHLDWGASRPHAPRPTVWSY